ncbi:uncharacterized protein CEXT_590192 [Caerostris extrusa]|uniref:Uncharacterized protein n=1 Tax=Caerostris extrusa TaxID=172846 RepID=A0AAV4WQ02_CAEEX|nr:uncharacterized protein CEXT_590192 [Caerostris extrusa]
MRPFWQQSNNFVPLVGTKNQTEKVSNELLKRLRKDFHVEKLSASKRNEDVSSFSGNIATLIKIDLLEIPNLKMKSVFAFIFILFAWVVIAVNTSAEITRQDVEADPDLEKYLREAIDNFREQMKVGIPEINMPILDPLVLKDLDINVDENLATMELSIKTIIVNGLSSFKFHHIYPDLESFFLQVNLTLPQVTSSGEYSLTGKLLKIFPLKGNGNFQINITEGEISGIGQLEFVNDTLEMTKLELDFIWKKLEVFLENFLGGGKFAQVLQKIIPAAGKSVFDNFKPDILKMMNRALIDEVNKELRKPEVKKIIEGILPGGI